MIEIRKSAERAHVHKDGLDSLHTFSFGRYYDERFVNFRALRVINEDTISPDIGFPIHQHSDMEILTYVISGELTHTDNLGNKKVIQAGEVQRMTAGTGIAHSEYNKSETDVLHLLQIWIFPDKENLVPEYQQKHFPDNDKRGRFCPIATPHASEGSMSIHQDVNLYVSIIDKATPLKFPMKEGRGAWIQVVRGDLTVNEIMMSAGDGAAIECEKFLSFTTPDEAELLLFDLA